MLWSHNLDGGAVNGELIEEYIVATVDRLGINPADIDGRYVASHFTSPSRTVKR